MLTSFAITSCERKKAVENRIKRVDIATGGCFGPCQLTAISIDSALQYHFYGGETSLPLPEEVNHNLEGYYAGRAKQQLWDSLCTKLNQIHYQQLDSAYKNSVDDQSLELMVYYGENKVKHVKAQSASLPGSIQDVLYWISKTYKRVQLKPSKDSTAFRTTIQWNPLEPPPLPKDD